MKHVLTFNLRLIDDLDVNLSHFIHDRFHRFDAMWIVSRPPAQFGGRLTIGNRFKGPTFNSDSMIVSTFNGAFIQFGVSSMRYRRTVMPLFKGAFVSMFVFALIPDAVIAAGIISTNVSLGTTVPTNC